MEPGYTISGDFLKDLRAMRHEWLLGKRTRKASPQIFPRAAREIHFLNASGEEVPAYAVMQVSDAERTVNLDFVEIVKPTAAGKLFLINGPLPVADDARGVGFHEGRVLYTTGDGTPALNEPWGPTTDWKLHKGGFGYTIVGAHQDGSVVAWKKPSGFHLGKWISGSIAPRTTGPTVASGNVQVWTINASNVIANSGKTVSAYNHSVRFLQPGEWVLLFEADGKWIVVRSLGAPSNYHVHAKILGNVPLVLNTQLKLAGVNTLFGTETSLPVFVVGGTNNGVLRCTRAGAYRWRAHLNIEPTPGNPFVQPADNTANSMRLRFNGVGSSGSANSTAGYANFHYLPQTTDTDADHDHGGAVAADGTHTHTLNVGGGVGIQTVIVSGVWKPTAAAETLDIRCDEVAGTAGVIGNYQVLSGSIDVEPIGCGDGIDEWAP
jgi:hypothetical protein